jgi:hypothetical protein
VKTKDSSEPTKDSLPSSDPREARLQEIRRQALNSSLASLPKRRSLIAHPSPETGYYGAPLLKKPQWTNEVPLYFFCGGAAGAAAIIASVAGVDGHNKALVRDARYIAAIGGMISPALLIFDLGMPSRFLNMLRVFKPQSPMSVGSWTLMAFSSSAAAAAFLTAWQGQKRAVGGIRVLQSAAEFTAAITGAVVSSYTGVLLGATAIPVWNQNVSILPVHFATSGMATASALLELRGHHTPALNAIGIATALGETAVGASIELRKNPALKPLKSGSSGWLTRIGGLLSGPVPLILRLLALGGDEQRKTKLRNFAAASTIAGSIATRFAWTRAGAASAEDNRLQLHGESPVQSNKTLEP